MQYLVPLAIPVFVALLLAPFLSGFSVARENSYGSPAPAAGSSLPVSPNHTAALVTEGKTGDNQPLGDEDGTVGVELNPAIQLTSSDKAEEVALDSAEASEAAELAVAVEGGSWDSQLYDAMSSACRNELDTVPYQTSIRTAFASFPRSGNSYLRSLIERATGYQTSSVCEALLPNYPAGGEADVDSSQTATEALSELSTASATIA